jgi:hypothetical protein
MKPVNNHHMSSRSIFILSFYLSLSSKWPPENHPAKTLHPFLIIFSLHAPERHLCKSGLRNKRDRNTWGLWCFVNLHWSPIIYFFYLICIMIGSNLYKHCMFLNKNMKIICKRNEFQLVHYIMIVSECTVRVAVLSWNSLSIHQSVPPTLAFFFCSSTVIEIFLACMTFTESRSLLNRTCEPL